MSIHLVKELTSIGLMQLHFDLPCFLFHSLIQQSNDVSDRLFLLPSPWVQLLFIGLR